MTISDLEAYQGNKRIVQVWHGNENQVDKFDANIAAPPTPTSKPKENDEGQFPTFLVISTPTQDPETLGAAEVAQMI